MRDRSLGTGTCRTGPEPERAALYFATFELRPYGADSALDLARPQARPPAQIIHRRGSMAGEVSKRELRESFLLRFRLGRRHPLIEEGVRTLPTAGSSATD